MAIKTNELNQPERGMALGNRESGSGTGPAGEGLTLQDRMQRAKLQATMAHVKMRLANRYKCECFERGWMAAIAEIENGTAG
jgi:hypothetical protein